MKFSHRPRLLAIVAGISLELALGLHAGRVIAARASIAAGASHSCELTAAGRVLCWGDNSHGQIGNGAGILPGVLKQTVPAEIAAGFSSLASGGDHTCGLQADGTAFCWGDNSAGQLGNGTTDGGTGTSLPVRVATPIKFKSLTAGWDHTCGLELNTGAAFCWGNGLEGQLGNAAPQPQSTMSPTRVVIWVAGQGPTYPVFVALAAGSNHTCGIMTGGQVYCWGSNVYLQTGIPLNSPNATTCYQNQPCILQPTAVTGISNATIIAAGSSATCISTASETDCWGNFAVGVGAPLPPHKETGISGLTSLSVGDDSACGTEVGGQLYCWGSGSSGELGNGVPVSAGSAPMPPALIAGVQDYASVSVGKSFACGVGVAGAVRCWGASALGQSGTDALFGVPAARPLPTQVSGIGLKGVWAGEAHACGIDTDGITLCWGSNSYGQIGHGRTGAPPPRQSVVPTPVARHYQQILIAGPLGAANAQPETLTNMIASSRLAAVHESAMSFVQLAVGENHTCAVTMGGEAYCWGEDEVGQIGDPSAQLAACFGGGPKTCVASPSHVQSPGTQFTQIAAGHGHTCAIGTDGKGYCWGVNGLGQLGNPNCPVATCIVPTPGLIQFQPVAQARLVSIAARSESACAVSDQGRVFCWGAGIGGLPKLISTSTFGPAVSDGEHTCVIVSTSPRKGGQKLSCKGTNQFGDVGTGSNQPVNALSPVLSGPNVADVTLGFGFTCAVRGAQGLCWGLNSAGELGVGATGNLNSPHPLSSAAGLLKSIAAGDQHACALSTIGSALCWGDNSSGQLGDGNVISMGQFAAVPVAAGVVLQ